MAGHELIKITPTKEIELLEKPSVELSLTQRTMPYFMDLGIAFGLWCVLFLVFTLTKTSPKSLATFSKSLFGISTINGAVSLAFFGFFVSQIRGTLAYWLKLKGKKSRFFNSFAYSLIVSALATTLAWLAPITDWLLYSAIFFILLAFRANYISIKNIKKLIDLRDLFERIEQKGQLIIGTEKNDGE